MRVIADTNVLVSALLWHGPPHTLLERARSGALMLVSSPALMAELASVMTRPKFAAILARSDTSLERTLAELGRLIELTDPPPLPQPVCRDLDDDLVLALAVAARVHMIISGDGDLLDIASFQGIPIVSPAQAMERIDALSGPKG